MKRDEFETGAAASDATSRGEMPGGQNHSKRTVCGSQSRETPIDPQGASTRPERRGNWQLSSPGSEHPALEEHSYRSVRRRLQMELAPGLRRSCRTVCQ